MLPGGEPHPLAGSWSSGREPLSFRHTRPRPGPAPQLWGVHLDGHCVLRVVRVPEHELEELGGAQRGVDGVLGGDGQAECAGDALGLRALPVGGDHLQVPGMLRTDTLLSLWDTSARPGPQS